ncbi:MAG: hypothetical protein JNK05_28330 [Myxococcales bacterium]|nr:hypothetical protein [Myxococcales bacterium]
MIESKTICALVLCALPMGACATTQRVTPPPIVIAEARSTPIQPQWQQPQRVEEQQQQQTPSSFQGWPNPLRAFQSARGDRGGEWDDIAPDPRSDARNPRAPIEQSRARGRPMRHATLAPGGFYAEATNADAAPVDGCGGTHLAIMYVPSATFRLDRIAVRAGVTQLGIFDDDNGRPGRLLALGPASGTQEPGWTEARLDEPIIVERDHRYWIYKGPGGCATSTGTDHALYYGHFDGQPSSTWEGPHRWHAYQFRYYGSAPSQ